MQAKTKSTLKEYLNTDEVAEIFGVSRETVYRWIKAKTLPARRLGKRMYRISRADIDRFVAGQKNTAEGVIVE